MTHTPQHLRGCMHQTHPPKKRDMVVRLSKLKSRRLPIAGKGQSTGLFGNWRKESRKDAKLDLARRED